MVLIPKLKNNILSKCPKCKNKLNHVNALDTEAKIYMVWCPKLKCRFCREYQFKKGVLVCL